MEEQTIVETPQQEPVVSFPDPKPERSRGGFPKWIFAVVGLVVILAAGGFFLYQSSSTTTTNPTPSPFVSGLSDLPTATETPSPTKTPVASAAPTPSTTQRAEVSIEVQNGTGTTGDAALAKSLVEKAGYKKFTTGNASSQDATSTIIKYSSDVPMAVITEIAQALSGSFGTAGQEGTLTGKNAIRIITGPKVKADAATKATATPTVKPTTTATPKPSATATASATPKATP